MLKGFLIFRGNQTPVVVLSSGVTIDSDSLSILNVSVRSTTRVNMEAVADVEPFFQIPPSGGRRW